MYLRGRRNVKIREEQAAAEADAREADERPSYSPEEEREIQQLWSEPIAEKEIEELTITSNINQYIDSCKPEKLKAFAYHFLKQGFELKNERAIQLAEIVAQNRDRLKGGFYNTRIRQPIIAHLANRQGSERNVAAVVLSQPKKFVDVFENFFKRPPGGKPFLSPEEWEHGKMPLKRRSGPSTI